MLFPDSRVEVGDVVAPGTFLVAWRGTDDSASALDFVVDPSAGCCRLLFARDTAFTFPDFHRRVPAVLLCCDVKLEFSVADVAEVLAFEADDSLLMRLSAAPLVYYRTAGDDVHDSVPFHLIDADDDPWIRTTDVTPSGAIGRCSAYRVSFAARFWPTMRTALEYMKKQGVPVDVCDTRCRGFTVLEEPGFGRPMQDVFFCLQHDEGLRFPELYLVNVLIHNGIVNPHQLTAEFFSLLRRAHEDVNVAALTELFAAKLQACNDPCSRLKKAQDRAAKNQNLLFRSSSSSSSRKLGDYNSEVRRLIITPTRAYCMPPQVERSNRVTRHYHQLSNRFLRVTFVDEGMLTLNSNALSLHVVPLVKDSMSCPSQQMTTVYRRVQTILTEGFTMCGRKYSFLAFSTSQLKQKSAWFFAEDGTTTVASIKEWMGQFPIRNPAKHAARMGLCFTSSYATVTMQPCEVNEYLEDVIHNGYNFSDGIGMITQDLALEVAERLPLTDNYAPSAYQIRYAGFKGVVAVSPGQNDGIRMMSLRPSMRKFESAHTVIYIFLR
jgi:RNA-dependent RNA polymerase